MGIILGIIQNWQFSISTGLPSTSRSHSVGFQPGFYLCWRGALGKVMPAVKVRHVPDSLLKFPLKLLDADVVLSIAGNIPVPQSIQPQNTIHLQPQPKHWCLDSPSPRDRKCCVWQDYISWRGWWSVQFSLHDLCDSLSMKWRLN